MKAYAHKKDGSFVEFDLSGKGKSGGEGAVYKIGTVAGLQGVFCAKIYHKDYLLKHLEKSVKLKYMVEHRPRNLSDTNGMIQICYPAFLLFDAPTGGNFIGYVMYHALENSRDLQNVAMNVNKARFESLRRIGKPDTIGESIYNKYPRPQSPADIDVLQNRYKIIHNICSVIHYLHQDGHYVIGDIKPENILMTVNAGISLVDVDSIQITENGKLLFANEASTPEYCPPEFLQHPQKIKTISFDLFSIAVLFYQILIGTHPYTYTIRNQSKQNDIAGNIRYGYYANGKKKKSFNAPKCHLLFDYLPQNVQDLFDRAFEGNPDTRPTAQEWKEAMRTLIHGTPVVSAKKPSPQPVKKTPKPKKSQASSAKPKSATQPQPTSQQTAQPAKPKSRLVAWIIIMAICILAAISALALASCNSNYNSSSWCTTTIDEYRARSVISDLCDAIADNNFYRIEQLYGDYLQRYYSRYGVSNNEVVAMCENYDNQFGVYGKHFNVRWNTFQTYRSDNGAIGITYIFDYYIDRYDPDKYSYFIIEKHIELDKNYRIISEYDVQLSRSK